MSNLETICKTLTNGLYGSFENTLLFLLKRHIKISILSVEHHIEYSNFWDDIRMKIGNFIIAYRIKYPDRFKTVIDFQYMKTEDGLIAKLDKQYCTPAYCLYHFFCGLSTAKENDVYSVANIDRMKYYTEDTIEYQKI